jgi:hypothetical chaperone protein
MALKIGLDFGTPISGSQRQALVRCCWTHQPAGVVRAIYHPQRALHGQEAVALYYRHNVNRLRRFVKKWVGEIDYHGADMFYVRDVYVYVDELQPGRMLQYLKTALRKTGGPGGYLGTQVFDSYYRVADLVQVYLRELKQRAEKALGEPVSGVTLGRPVKFNNDPALDHQAQETLREAAHLAGFEQVDFELEPVAAALAYEMPLTRPQTALIFDFGGGTLDIAILRLGDKSQRQVFASGGIDIAGSDFDRAIIHNRLLDHFGLEHVRSQPDLLELVLAVPDWSALPDLSTPLNWHNLERAVQSRLAPARLKALQALIFNDLAFFYNQVRPPRSPFQPGRHHHQHARAGPGPVGAVHAQPA